MVEPYHVFSVRPLFLEGRPCRLGLFIEGVSLGRCRTHRSLAQRPAQVKIQQWTQAFGLTACDLVRVGRIGRLSRAGFGGRRCGLGQGRTGDRQGARDSVADCLCEDARASLIEVGGQAAALVGLAVVYGALWLEFSSGSASRARLKDQPSMASCCKPDVMLPTAGGQPDLIRRRRRRDGLRPL